MEWPPFAVGGGQVVDSEGVKDRPGDVLGGNRVVRGELGPSVTRTEDLAAAARDEWNDLNASVPPLVEKLQARVNELSKSRKYPKGMDKAKFEEAKTGFEALKSEWTEASSEFAAGEAGNAVRKARDAKAKAEELMTQLEVKA